MLDSGTTLQQGRYLIVRHLAKGGMGSVYEAKDQRLHTTVALKETFFTDEMLRRQFEREARMLANLRHPALPRVSDHFNENGGQFLVMDFIAGVDLEEMRKSREGGAFAPQEVLRWGDQLLDALEYLHTQTPPIVHRDIKPQNLKLTARDQIILLDFGLAKGFAGETSQVSSIGSVFGYTPSYAPLEQIQATGTDPRSDLYSLAATLYHLLTGVAPPNALARATAVLNGEADPLRTADEVNPSVARDVGAALGQTLALKRDQRPASATAMRNMLRVARATQEGFDGAGVRTVAMQQPAAPRTSATQSSRATEATVTAQPVAAPMLERQSATVPATERLPPLPVAEQSRLKSSLGVGLSVSALLLLMAVALTGLYFYRRSQASDTPALNSTAPNVKDHKAGARNSNQAGIIAPANPSAATTSATGDARLTLKGHSQNISSIAFSTDGKTLASGSWDHTVKLWDAQSGELKQTIEEPGYTINAVTYRPDGKALVIGMYDAKESIITFLDNASAKPEAETQRITDPSNLISAVAFSPDGRTLLTVTGSKVQIWDAQSGAPKLMIDGGANAVAALAPDGKTIALGGSNENDVKLFDAQTGKLKLTLVGHTKGLLSVAFSPDGKTLASGSYDSTAKLWDTETGTLKQTLSEAETEAIFSLAFARDGQMLATGSFHSVRLWNAPDGKQISTFPLKDDGIAASLAFSPDGRMLAGGCGNAVKLWDVGR